ncbi:MAG: ABC transporter permease [Anaerolineae bacterium]|nr:ABC transporter permease [Anaerolineae bacterium]
MASLDTQTRQSTALRLWSTAVSGAHRPRWHISRFALPTIGLLVFLFLYVPILIVILYSFNSGTHIGQWEGFSLRWYQELFQDQDMGRAFEVTLWVSTLSTIISTILGTAAALAMERYLFRGKVSVDALLYLPLIIPDIVMALSLLLFFSSVGVDRNRWTILIAHVAFNISYVVVVVRARLASMDPHLEEAAADLYANPWQTFRRVTLPLLMPGIISGALLSFTLSFDEFVITSFVSGQGDTTVPVKIYSMLRFGLKPEINAVATLILLASSVLVVASLLLQRNNAKNLIGN